MKATIKTEDNCVHVNDALIPKNGSIVSLMANGVRLSGSWGQLDILLEGSTIDGNPVGDAQEMFEYFKENSFSLGGGDVSEGVVSVTGTLVKGTSSNPVIDKPTWTDVINKPETFTPSNHSHEIGDINSLQLSLDGKQSISEKGQAGGYPSLDNSGKIPLEFLNVSGLTFKGAWDASTNTPTLLDGTGLVGDFYKVSVGGTYNFGNGEHTFAEGDWVMFAAGVWQRIGVHETVQSVNGKTGAVVINKSDVGLGNADNTSDANKPVSISQAASIETKQDKLISGTNIKTIAGQSLMGSGNIVLPGVSEFISSTVQDGFTINEYVDRTEYLAKIITPNTTVGTGGGRYQTYTSTYRLPEGKTINGADWCEINLRNNNRTISVAVYDNTNRYIAFGYFNNYNDAGSAIASPVLFIRLTYYK